MDEKVDAFELKELFEIIKKRMGLILSITLVSTLITGVFSYFFMTPIYEAKTEILVNQETNKNIINNQEIQGNLNLVSTYSVIVTSPRILDTVANDLGLNDSQRSNLSNQITVSSVKNSQIISITVENPSQSMAATIANAVAYTFKNEIPKIMSINNVQVLTEAKGNPNAVPVKPNKTLNILIGFVVALMVSVGLSFLLEYMDNTIKTERDIEKVLDLPILGAVPQIQESKAKKKSRYIRPYEKVAATRERRA